MYTMNICIDNIPSYTPCICTTVNTLIYGVSLKNSQNLPRRYGGFYFVFSCFLFWLTKSNSLRKKFLRYHDIQLITSKLMQ